jgi:hypothetical protein
MITSLLALVALGIMGYELVQLMEIGTCASGGPYVSARECPNGTGAKILLLTAAIIVYVFATIAASFRSFSAGMFWFGLLFVGLGGAFLYAEAAGKVNGGGGVGWILGGVFVPMGLFPLLGGIKGLLDEARDDGETQPLWATPYVVGSELRRADPPQQG